MIINKGGSDHSERIDRNKLKVAVGPNGVIFQKRLGTFSKVSFG